MAKSKTRTFAHFPYPLRSCTGYLEGTHKAAHTVKNYRLDLLSFEEFLNNSLGDRPVALDQITLTDLDRFHEHLKSKGLKTNTRRRKLLTVRKFLGYLVNRKKLPVELGKKMPTPHKIERIPQTVSSEQLLRAIQLLPTETLIDERNRVLLWVLAETGIQVSEVAALRYENFESGRLELHGKAPRSLIISEELLQALQHLRTRSSGSPWVFSGFNRYGSLGAAISPRGVELLVKFYSSKLGQGELTPRTFRHSAVVTWFREGVSKDEIQQRLGLKTRYAFRTYEPLFKDL